jgi:hypothetical protein
MNKKNQALALINAHDFLKKISSKIMTVFFAYKLINSCVVNQEIKFLGFIIKKLKNYNLKVFHMQMNGKSFYSEILFIHIMKDE